MNSSLAKLKRKGEIMPHKSERTKVVKKIIVIFDICSSALILENLILTENQKLWPDLLIDLKIYLRRNRSSVGYELYKFLGDGWILLFDPRPGGLEIFKFLENLSDKFLLIYRRLIKKVLPTQIPVVGLTFGMDIGSCFRFVMNQQTEYTGRPLNLAARLQDAIGQRGNNPENKVLISNNLYDTFKDKVKIRREYTVWKVNRKLKNITGGEKYWCRKVELK